MREKPVRGERRGAGTTLSPLPPAHMCGWQLRETWTAEGSRRQQRVGSEVGDCKVAGWRGEGGSVGRVTKSQRRHLPPGCIPTLTVAGKMGSATYAKD